MIRHSASHVVEEDFEYVQGIIDRNYIGAGPLCAELKARLSARFERNHVTLTHSGTAALHLALMALSLSLGARRGCCSVPTFVPKWSAR